MNVSMIPAEVDPRIRSKLDREAAEASRVAEEARRAERANAEQYDRAYGAWSEASAAYVAAEGKRGEDKARERSDRLWAACDTAFKGALSSHAARVAAERRLAELENPALVAQIARREQEKRERFDELERMRQQREAESENGSAVTKIVPEKKSRGGFPQVVDNGDGLAQLDRESLRILCRANSLSVAGHKAVVIERLRERGVTP